jgi:hypothetical protein
MLIGVRIVGSIIERFSRSTSNISARYLGTFGTCRNFKFGRPRDLDEQVQQLRLTLWIGFEYTLITIDM